MRKLTLAVPVVLLIMLLAVGGVAAHGDNGSTADHDRVPENASAVEWTTWMDQYMTDQMGADAAADMQERMGMSYDEMGEHMASNRNGSMMNGRMMDGPMNRMTHGGMSGMGCH